ncbi:MAG: DUF4392 domain-containing protein [Thiolinea sp.]
MRISTSPDTLHQITAQLEDMMVRKNLRGMKQLQAHLQPGYFMRAAEIASRCKGVILIGTGFPVIGTFETDGPVGAIALYEAFETLGAHPVLVCGTPLALAVGHDYRIHQISVGDISKGPEEARQGLEIYQPELIISIERPGLNADGYYANMRGEDISAGCACFDYFVTEATCPTIAIGDGGNEIGMGNALEGLKELNIIPAVTTCDELLIADVSNWAAFGLIALLSIHAQQDLLAQVDTLKILEYLSRKGSVDGVTRENTLTEDGLEAINGQQLINDLRHLTGFAG